MTHIYMYEIPYTNDPQKANGRLTKSAERIRPYNFYYSRQGKTGENGANLVLAGRRQQRHTINNIRRPYNHNEIYFNIV